MSSLINALFLRLHIWKIVSFGSLEMDSCTPYVENTSLGSLQMDICTQGGKAPCLAHSVCVTLHDIGLWDLNLRKIIQFHYLVS